MAVHDEVIRLILELKKSPGNEEIVKNLEQLKTKLEDTDKAAQKASHGVAGMGQSFLQSGRVIQDFAQGGIPGILNNIEGLTMALGLGSGLAGILTIAGVAAFTAGPAIKSFFQGLADGSNKIPETTNKVEGLNEKLKDNKERLEELRKSQTLTNTELKEYNRLTGENITLTKELDKAQEEKKQHEAFGKLKPLGVAEAERERGGILQAEFGGQDITGLAKTFDERIAEEHRKALQDFRALPPPDPRRPDPNRGALWKKLGYLERLRGRGGQAIMEGGIMAGTKEDIEAAAEFMPPGARERFAQALPANIAARHKEEEEERIWVTGKMHRDKIRGENQKAATEKKQRLDKAMAEEWKDKTEGANAESDAQQRGIQEGRDIGKQLKAQKDAQDKKLGMDTEKLRPLRDPNAAGSQVELNQILQENQAITASNEMIISRQIFQSRQTQEQLRNVSNPMVGQN